MVNKLAEELKKLREYKGVSLREIERDTKISNAYLSQLERGEAKKPSPDILKRLANYYKVEYESLMKAAGYLKARSKQDTIKPIAIQAALMSKELSDEENKLVVEYIKFLRSQRKSEKK